MSDEQTNAFDLYRKTLRIDADLAAEVTGIDHEPISRGDDVLTFIFGDKERPDTYLHLRRGMDREEVAQGLEEAANAIRAGADE